MVATYLFWIEQSSNISCLSRAKSHKTSSIAQSRNIPILSRNGRKVPVLGRNGRDHSSMLWYFKVKHIICGIENRKISCLSRARSSKSFSSRLHKDILFRSSTFEHNFSSYKKCFLTPHCFFGPFDGFCCPFLLKRAQTTRSLG